VRRATLLLVVLLSAAHLQAERAISLDYYYTPGCASCARFLAEEIPRLERSLGLPLHVSRRDALDPKVFSELDARAAALGVTVTGLPVIVAGDTVLQGEGEIRARLAPLLERLAAAPQGPAAQTPAAPSAAAPAPAAPPARAPVEERLAILPVIAGGLLDGVNPCAFTTLIFLLASLALAGRGRREVLVIGGLFTLGVFLTYLGIGLGFFAALRAAAAFPVVSLVLRWVLVAILVAFAGLSFYDFAVIRAGRPTEIILQLPKILKRQIHASIRTRVRSATVAASSLALGFLVSVFEFACTGQVYLPTLAYLVRLRPGPAPILLLVAYNLGFIAPLLAVFVASGLGVGSERITRLFQRRMGAVKVGLGVFFLALAVLTLAG
jgi:cytochrome c biogenesis protein CcdA